jgi:hypothetical protein
MYTQLNKWLKDGRLADVMHKLTPIVPDVSTLHHIWASVQVRYQQNLAGFDEFSQTEAMTRESLTHLLEKHEKAIKAHFGEADTAKKPQPIRVFLTYHQTDSAWVDTLQHNLEDAGFDVLRDVEDMHPGETIEAFLERMLNMKGFVAPVISRQSLSSGQIGKATYLASLADYFGKNSLLPILLDNSLFDDQLIFDLVSTLDKDLETLEAHIARSKSMRLEYDQFETQRKLLAEHRFMLPKLVNRLQSTVFVDMSGEKFAEGLQKMIGYMR